MALILLSASFDDATLGVHVTRTDDGQVLSVLFDSLGVESTATDIDAQAQTVRVSGSVRCEGQGWVTVHARGAVVVAGDQGYAHAMGWANGRRLRLKASSTGEPISASVTAPVGADGLLRLSLLLVAQRDLAMPDSAAALWLDSLDIQVVPARCMTARGIA